MDTLNYKEKQMKEIMTNDIKNFTNHKFADLVYFMKCLNNSGKWDSHFHTITYEGWVKVAMLCFKEKFGRKFRGYGTTNNGDKVEMSVEDVKIELGYI
tara:strand:+ start:961 stop:1254 length:294 start_codon:yes stop_codon:yes gene_type:complete